ncbi:MAG TPA: DJ-1/PfpI family protein [Holophagaceae bacterium]|nr:DJ-1/PfpI family protein [Holophagaceae bacterium]
MALVKASAVHPAKVGEKTPAKTRVAILLFEGVQIIDFAGPYEVFGHAGFDVFTVAEKAAPVTTAMGLTVTPRFTFESCPLADILVIPGGDVDQAKESLPIRHWVQERSQHVAQLMSVCNGALILGNTGLLDGQTATTYYRALDALQAEAPKVKVVWDRRYVDNGEFITTAGLSSGIDGALHLVERLKGKGEAQAAALSMEYDWRPDSGFARAALADQEIPNVAVPGINGGTMLITEGDRSVWHQRMEVESDLTLEALDASLRKVLEGKGWVREAGGKGESQWRFKGRNDAPWHAAIHIAPSTTGRYLVRLELHKG